jgi:photosystem II stability/assembly factor-like uncharacterized protein
MHIPGRTPFRKLRRTLITLTALSLSAFIAFEVLAQQPQYSAALLAGLRWRDVGPMRGGRTFGVAGHASQPDTFYMGSVGGGVFKTENSGRTWVPISDEGIPIGSIGAIAVAPSNANVIYVGTGEPDIRSQHSYGIGMFKSTDGGKTWTHIGLDATEHIGRVVIDPANPNRVYVAALGHVYNSNPERGLYRTTDGGATWKKILWNKDAPNDVGAIDVAVDAKNPRVLYASLWGTRRPPWSVYAPSNLPGGGLWKSTDGGDTWKQLTTGLPHDEFVGKIGIAIAPSNPNRLWAVVDDLGAGVAPARQGGGRGGAERDTGGGVYVSDDAGANWHRVNSESRGRGGSLESRSGVRDQHGDLHDDGRRQDLGADQGRAGRRRLSPDVDQSARWESHGAEFGSGHGGQRGWRENVEHLVQPADGADLSRGGGQSLPVLAVWSPAG